MKSSSLATVWRTGETPFVATAPGRFRERFAGVCKDCHLTRVACNHHPELPLKLLFIGHNPSDHAFSSGFFYSNPTNRMWLLLTGRFDGQFEGIVPPTWPITNQNKLSLYRGMGLSDLGVVPGNDAAAYSPAVLAAWKQDMYRALAGHTARVRGTLALLRHIAAQADTESQQGSAASEGPSRKRRKLDASSSASASAVAGVTFDHGADSAAGASASAPAEPSGLPPFVANSAWRHTITPAIAARMLHFLEHQGGLDLVTGAPRMVAFTGKSQWKCLFTPPLATCDTGLQPANLRPPGWPLPPSTGVFVLHSSSGRAAMTNAVRRAPYEALAKWFNDPDPFKGAGPWMPQELAEALDVGTDIDTDTATALLGYSPVLAGTAPAAASGSAGSTAQRGQVPSSPEAGDS